MLEQTPWPSLQPLHVNPSTSQRATVDGQFPPNTQAHYDRFHFNSSGFNQSYLKFTIFYITGTTNIFTEYNHFMYNKVN